MPYLSIVIPTYNNEKTIGQCLTSIRKSAYQDYELIVVDSGSQDKTLSIARQYADQVIELPENNGRSWARINAIKAAKGEIIINIDSDVLIKSDTLKGIADYFLYHGEICALTGLLSTEHPHSNFFSQYKNLYMNYIFNRLPGEVTFLYGCLYALRRRVAQLYNTDVKIADDTALGQKLISEGCRIGFLKNLEVVHLKKYDLFAFIKNDFQIPFDWAKIFFRFKGWKQLGKNKTGFAHSPKEQLVSVILAPTILLLCLVAILGYASFPLILALILSWFFLNCPFLSFLVKEKGIFFGILSSFVTFVDNIIMALGILCGSIAFFLNMKRNSTSGEPIDG